MSQGNRFNHFFYLMSAVILCSGTMGLLGRMTATAYPIFQQYFQATIVEMQWVMTAPILAAASMILIGGRLGDFFGKRRLFRIGLIIFSLGNVLSALSVNIIYLIVGQSLIGFGMSLSAPTCLSLIKQEVSHSRQGEAIGMWAGLSGFFGVLGLFAGGIIIEQLGWQAVFYSTLLFTILAILIVPKERLNNADIEKKLINWKLAFSLFLTMFLLAYSLINGNQNTWQSLNDYIMVLIAILLFLGLIFWQNKKENPLIPMRIFKNTTVLGANLGTFFIYFSLNGIYIFLVFHLQSFYKYPPSQAGWAMIPASLMVTLFASHLGKYAQKGNKAIQMLRTGAIMTSIAFFVLLLPGSEAGYFSHFFPAILLLGIGMALFVSPLTSFALKVSSSEGGLASGINNLIARFSGIMSVVILGGIFGIYEEGVERFRLCVLLMAVSATIGVIFLWRLIPKKKEYV